MVCLSDIVVSDDFIKYTVKKLIELIHDDTARLIMDMKSEDIRTLSIYIKSKLVATFSFSIYNIEYLNELKKLLCQEMDFRKEQKEYYS
jgi:hypothetical protein